MKGNAQSERRKFKMSCREGAGSALNLPMTAFASEPWLACDWMACSKSFVRPSCKKNSRWPMPHNGAVRNSSPAALPWMIPSAKPLPMDWSAKSLYGKKSMPPYVVCFCTWQVPQPMLVKVCRPLIVDEVSGAGVGGADSRMNASKFSTSGKKSDAGLPLGGLLLASLNESSGVSLNWQPGVSSRSFGNPELVTPCSTL